MYREYLKLSGLHILNSIYTELGDESIGDFLKLCKLSKKEDISREQVVKLLQLAMRIMFLDCHRLKNGANGL